MSDIAQSRRLLARRVKLLGGEGVFKSAAEANAAAAAGQKVYPFHLGNVGFPTPQNIVDAMNKAILDGHTGYCQNEGIPQLREAIAWDVGRARDLHYGVENVAVQPGGKPVIGKFLLTLMEPGDEVLYPNPGFPIYGSLIGHFGGRPVPYTYHETSQGFTIDLEGLEEAITPRTRLLILNDPHNPSGAECSPEELKRIAELAIEHDLQVLCDEAYFDVRFDGGKGRSLASLPGMQDRCVILFTFAKRYAMGGWRLGAAVGPKDIIDVIVTLNTNVESCTNTFVQWAGVEALTGDQSGAAKILEQLRKRRDAGVPILASTEGVTCHREESTFYFYPNITGAMKKGGYGDYETFRRTVLRETGVSMATRAMFGDPLPGEQQYHLRFSYSGIEVDQIEEGLNRLKTFLEGDYREPDL
jgi:aspartate/methionine/tyrosine aminotransferase